MEQVPEAEGRGKGGRELSVLRMPQKKSQGRGDEVKPKNRHMVDESVKPGEARSGGWERKVTNVS